MRERWSLVVESADKACRGESTGDQDLKSCIARRVIRCGGWRVVHEMSEVGRDELADNKEAAGCAAHRAPDSQDRRDESPSAPPWSALAAADAFPPGAGAAC